MLLTLAKCVSQSRTICHHTVRANVAVLFVPADSYIPFFEN